MNTINNIIAAVVGLLIAALLVSTFWYRGQYHSSQQLLEVTQVQLKNQAAEAEQTLAWLKAERDEKQLAIDNAYKSQEKKDAQAQADINRLTDELLNSDVRVRIQCTSGQSSDSAKNKSSATANNNSGNASPTYGLLPKANSERLARAIKEIEQLSAAYSSCRSTLSLNQHMP